MKLKKSILLFLLSINFSYASAKEIYILKEKNTHHPIKDSPYFDGIPLNMKRDGFLHERRIFNDYIKEYYPKAVSYRKKVNFYLHDINEDRQKEIFVVIKNPGFCGLNQSHLLIFKDLHNMQKGNHLISECISKQYKKTKILNSKTAYYNDLLLARENKYEIWKWDNQAKYKFSGLTDLRH